MSFVLVYSTPYIVLCRGTSNVDTRFLCCRVRAGQIRLSPPVTFQVTGFRLFRRDRDKAVYTEYNICIPYMYFVLPCMAVSYWCLGAVRVACGNGSSFWLFVSMSLVGGWQVLVWWDRSWLDVVKRGNYSRRSKNMQRDLFVDGVGLMLVSVYIVCFEEYTLTDFEIELWGMIHIPEYQIGMWRYPWIHGYSSDNRIQLFFYLCTT